MAARTLYLHLPRTSGTSLSAYFQASMPLFFVQANARSQVSQDPPCGRVRNLDDIRNVLRDFNGLLLHVDHALDGPRSTTTFRSLAWHVFDPLHRRVFEDCRILMMLRNPFHAFLSTFAFVRRAMRARPGFLPDLEVQTVEAFLDAVHPNAILHFLLEPELSRRRVITRSDLDRVVEVIRTRPVHVGIYERHAESVVYFGRAVGRVFDPLEVPHKNVGDGVPEHAAKLEAEFRSRNTLDFALYETAVRLFDERLKVAP